MTTLKYRNKHRQEIREYNKKYYQEHKSYWEEFNKTRDKEKHREIIRIWQRNHLEWRKEYRNKNRIAYRAYWNNRRTKLKDLTKETIQLVYEDNIKQYGTLTCYLCLEPIKFGKDHLEHKIPLSRGGSNLYENLAIACEHCNYKKNNKTEKEYRSLKV